MTWQLINEDAVKWANEYDGLLFHALFADAPYNLTSIAERFSSENAASAQYCKDLSFHKL